MSKPKPRRKLKAARERLALTQHVAAQLVPGLKRAVLSNLECGVSGKRNRGMLLEYCKVLRELAVGRGYDGFYYHESVLCPGEFPAPKVDE